MTRTERLARIGEHAQKWVRLEAVKESARRVNARAWMSLHVEIDDRIYPAVRRGRSENDKPGYFWTEYASDMDGGGDFNVRADSDPRVHRLMETWAAYSKAKQAAGRARAVITKACRSMEKSK